MLLFVNNFIINHYNNNWNSEIVNLCMQKKNKRILFVVDVGWNWNDEVYDVVVNFYIMKMIKTFAWYFFFWLSLSSSLFWRWSALLLYYYYYYYYNMYNNVLLFTIWCGSCYCRLKLKSFMFFFLFYYFVSLLNSYYYCVGSI